MYHDMNSELTNGVVPRPSHRYRGEDPPLALAHLRDLPRWVAWEYRSRGGRLTKLLPIDPHTGRPASVGHPDSWGTFDEALTGMQQHGAAGVGLVLTGNDDIIGIDLDKCIADSGLYAPLAAEVLEYRETYAEISPSGEGINRTGA